MADIVPFNFSDHEIRVILDEQGNPWWVAVDVCAVLEYADTHSAIRTHCDDEDTFVQVIARNGKPPVRLLTVNESGMYALVFGSGKPDAKIFRRWVTSEVLPQIRKTGKYSRELTRREILERALEAEIDAEKALQAVAELAPKAVEYDHYMATDELVSMNELAKALGGGRQRLIDRLRELKFFMSKNGAQGNGALPYQAYVDVGWFEIKLDPTNIGFVATAYVTPAGVTGIYQALVINGVGNRRWERLPVSSAEVFERLGLRKPYQIEGDR